MKKRHLLLMALAVLLMGNTCGAQTPVDPSQASEVLYEQGIKIAKEGRLKEGLALLEQALSLDKNDPTVIADYIVVLTWDEQFQEAIDYYHENSSVRLPDYVLPEVARAYRELGNYGNALKFYESYLASYPDDTNVRLGAFRVALWQEDFKPANEHIGVLLRSDPKNSLYHFHKAEIYAYQDRLAQAQEYLTQIIPTVEDNTRLKTLLAQIYLWRGWPRKALSELETLRKEDSDFILANNAYANALNATAQGKKARAHIKEVLQQFPDNRSFKTSQRQFDIEEKVQMTLRSYYAKEFSGEDELYASGRIEKMVRSNHVLFTEFARRLITNQPDDDVNKRIYVGDVWKPNNTWRIVGAITADPDSGRDLGGLGQLGFTPDDHWSFNFRYESRAFDIPLRSRVAGTTAADYSLSTTYRLSESFNSTLGASLRDYTDGNESWAYYWYTDTALYSSARWKARLGTDFYAATNSNQNVPYFSPAHSFSLYVTPMIEHVWFRKSDRAFIERYYLGVGQVWQENFNGENVGFLRYEQEHKFNDTTSVVVGSTYSLNSYDGQDSNRLNFYVTLRKAF